MKDISILNTGPFVGTVDGFLTEEECSSIIGSSFNFTRSTGFDAVTGAGVVVPSRTSSYKMLDLGWSDYVKDKIYQTFRDRFITNSVSEMNFEPFIVQRYEQDQQYLPHHDFFEVSGQKPIRNNRIATVLIYLNQDFQGGQTEFPHLPLTITPIRARLLYFEYDRDPDTNRLTQHAGLPVIQGKKYLLTSWIRQQPITIKNWWE